MLYVGGVFWFARGERRESERAVKKVDSLALASFGADEGVPGWPTDAAGLAARWAAEDRKALEQRLRRVPGKTIAVVTLAPSAWEPLKRDPRPGRVAVPPDSRVLDFRDKPTCSALEALFGTGAYLWVVASYAVEGEETPVAAVRFQAVVFNKQAEVVWMHVFSETERPQPGAAPGPSRDAATLEPAMRLASARAIESIGSALEGR